MVSVCFTPRYLSGDITAHWQSNIHPDILQPCKSEHSLSRPSDRSGPQDIEAIVLQLEKLLDV
jgi:hypothetical protein